VLHGSNVSIGCIPIGNPGIEELFLLLNRNWQQEQGYGRIHIFPCRFDTPECEQRLQTIAQDRPKFQEFWDSLRPVHRHFSQTGRVPSVRFDGMTGYYVLAEAEAAPQADVSD
jgi:murein L,D-transpeptidase YafK